MLRLLMSPSLAMATLQSFTFQEHHDRACPCKYRLICPCDQARVKCASALWRKHQTQSQDGLIIPYPFLAT
ncbi:hypothetical protein BDR07DRAFT_1391213 [Suillus spraguei]|nr:hypothetical protein BDR07DRAFT_1438026 [Suillus spraguei]KAG2368364.1 hypothetical protein BDR07DRAFT_1391213 [Suillus spraguei]